VVPRVDALVFYGSFGTKPGVELSAAAFRLLSRGFGDKFDVTETEPDDFFLR
jgi:hypothetical protein